MRVAWLKVRIWKLSGIGRGFERGKCPLCRGQEVAEHILLKYSETKNWREECECSKCLNINKDTACQKITNYKWNKVKQILENIYSKLDASGRTQLEGYKPHFRLQGNRNINYKVDCDKRKYSRNRTGVVMAKLIRINGSNHHTNLVLFGRRFVYRNEIQLNKLYLQFYL